MKIEGGEGTTMHGLQDNKGDLDVQACCRLTA